MPSFSFTEYAKQPDAFDLHTESHFTAEFIINQDKLGLFLNCQGY